ncbi:hypothetical protein ANN_06397 [Periplaneta americana]|uniref:Reverse transcriptase n=1 Tax=Periplaneta americana TaxID=6978 RepID=A0ABQ8TF15_PERAM|nr:hypothetical protein ANN_06397 [Periplaneta americana]
MINDAITKINDDLESIWIWTRKFRLKLNPEKSQSIIVGHSRLLSTITIPNLSPIKIHGTEIPFSESVKNLDLNGIDLARDRTRNLVHRRPALYQLDNQVDPSVVLVGSTLKRRVMYDGPFRRYLSSSSVSLEPLLILALRCAVVDAIDLDLSRIDRGEWSCGHILNYDDDVLRTQEQYKWRSGLQDSTGLGRVIS